MSARYFVLEHSSIQLPLTGVFDDVQARSREKNVGHTGSLQRGRICFGPGNSSTAREHVLGPVHRVKDDVVLPMDRGRMMLVVLGWHLGSQASQASQRVERVVWLGLVHIHPELRGAGVPHPWARGGEECGRREQQWTGLVPG